MNKCFGCGCDGAVTNGFAIKDDLRVVALYGRSQSGKTPTLALTLVKLITLCGFEIEKCVSRKFDLAKLIEDSGQYKFSNRSCVLRKQVGETVKRIGFTTVGDNVEELKKAFSLFGNCDLYVCAMHEKTKTEKFVDSITKRGKSYKYSRFAYFESGAQTVDIDQEKRILNDLQSSYLASKISVII